MNIKLIRKKNRNHEGCKTVQKQTKLNIREVTKISKPLVSSFPELCMGDYIIHKLKAKNAQMSLLLKDFIYATLNVAQKTFCSSQKLGKVKHQGKFLC